MSKDIEEIKAILKSLVTRIDNLESKVTPKTKTIKEGPVKANVRIPRTTQRAAPTIPPTIGHGCCVVRSSYSGGSGHYNCGVH